MANKKNDPNHLGFGRLMAWKSSDIAMAGLNVIVLGYLTIYCSDTLGIAPAVVGTVLMVSKIIDAFTDVFAGWLVDNTHTKLGKGRPYELSIVGIMICSLGLFSGSPAWSNTIKVVWIFCMYTLVFSIFTTLRNAAGTPYTIRHFSNNPILIRKVASYGGIITMAGSMIISMLFPIVMSKLATSAGGWRTTVAIFIIPLLLISLLRFFLCKEDPSVDGDGKQFQPVRLNEIFSMFRRNKYVWLYAIIMLCYNVSTSLAVTTYYFKYIIGNTAMMSVTAIFSIVLLPLMLVFPWIMKKIEESDQTHFDCYAESWLKRQEPYFKATTLAGYKRNLEIVYPFIGGIPLAKIRPLTLEEMCEELRKRPGRNGNPIKECTVQKYLETVSSVLEDAKKNDIIPFNPAHRVRKRCVEKEKQHIPQKYEMQRLLKIIMDEPILYKAYYTMAIATGLRRGELCALRWKDITGPFEFTIRHSRSYVAGQGIVESDTKNHRERIIVIPAQVWEFLMSLRHWQTIRNGKPDNSQPIFTDLDGHVPNPDTFTRHLRKLYAKNGFPKEYHLHTLRHYYATYLLQEGTSKQVAADLLGHADTAFLERTYCHPQDMAKHEVANLMDDLLSPKSIYHQPFKFVLKGKKVG